MIGRTALLSAAAVATLLTGTSTAKADLFDDLRVRIDIGNRRPEVRRVWVEPVYETRLERVWVEPVYQDRYERIWREPIYEDRCERVWVPDRYELRTETYRDHYGRRVTREVRVLVQPGHYTEQRTRVLVREGYWEEIPTRVCISEGRWTEVRRQVVVREGYWTDEVVGYQPAGRIEIGYERERRRSDEHNPRRDRDDDRRDRDRGDRYDRPRERR